MTPNSIAELVLGILFLVFAVSCWRGSRARKRLVAIIKAAAVGRRNEIDGRSLEQCLDILNQGATQSLVASDAVVVIYEGREVFFVDGTIGYLAPSTNSWKYTRKNLCFIVAIGRSAVKFLSEQEQVFRMINGSTELAAFSIFRPSEFANVLMEQAKGAERT
jgi:hypothetical protein